MAITSLDQLDLNGTYSYADYLTWQFDEMVELIDGKIYPMFPTPLVVHQVIRANIGMLLYKKAKAKNAQLFSCPLDVRFGETPKIDETVFDVVQPDIFIVLDKSKLDDFGLIGAPDFVVEILSTHTNKKDLTVKYALYEQNGVKEYWIVYPSVNIIDVFDLIDDNYILRKKYTIEDEIPVGIFPDFTIKAEDIFSE